MSDTHSEPSAHKSQPQAVSRQREVVFAIICPIGAQKEPVKKSIRETLELIGYAVELVKISALLANLPGIEEHKPSIGGALEKRHLMNAGDELRRRYKRTSAEHGGEAAAILSITEMNRKRKTLESDKPIAFVIDSLKNPAEIDVLRETYGEAFYAVGIYVPEDKRREALSHLAGANNALIEELLDRDRRGDDRMGQLVQESFYLCDFFVDGSQDDAAEQVRRFVELAFGNPLRTPTREEIGMFAAYSIQSRSGALGRQVGVAIMRDDASFVSIGANEVARPITGGQYLPEDDKKYHGRDLVYEEGDTSNWYRREVVEDLLCLLHKAGYLSVPEGKSAETFIRFDLVENDNSPLKDAKIENTIDYMRPVHAEAAALLDAARHGVATLGCTLFTTTFPCHECARHLVAAGIREVVYLEPYDKSGVKRLYKDSISVDTKGCEPAKLLFRSFVGIAPRRYLQYFLLNGRKRKSKGKVETFELAGKDPYLPPGIIPEKAVHGAEARVVEGFMPFIASLKLEPLNPEEEK